MTGDLTTDWRAENPVSETGHDLLARIANKRAISGAAKGRSRQGGDAKPINAGGLPEIPKTWTWATLEALVVSGPTNGYSPKKSADGSGTLALKLTATTKGCIDLSARAVKALSETIAAESDLFLKPGDLLFQRGNTIECVGIAAIYNGPSNRYVYPDLMIRVRTAFPILTEWIGVRPIRPWVESICPLTLRARRGPCRKSAVRLFEIFLCRSPRSLKLPRFCAALPTRW